VSAEIWNISGQRVNTLMEGEVAAGSYSFTWNGDDNMGRKVPQGIYLVRVSTGLGHILTERVALIK
jgi:flagellar hook assembly protein FlgD